MAKPNHAYPSPVSLYTPARLRPPRFPSPAILSALAVFATHPVVAGSPLPPPSPPPPFLCPFIERDSIPATSIPPSSPAPLPQCGALADRYVQGTDGLWKKTETWALYGSTVSVILRLIRRDTLNTLFQCYSTSTSSTSPVPSSSQSSNPTFSASLVEFDTSVLPAGWDGGASHSSNVGSTTILALATALAGSICVFIIGCVIWRRRKKKARDIERKLGHRPGAHDNSQDNGQEKDPRGKMRIWAKASARWKANVRQSARRRRKRPTVSSVVNRPLHPAFSDSPQPSVAAPSTPSRRASIASEEPHPSRSEALTDPPAVLHDPRPRSLSPPTYGATFIPRCSHLSLNSAAPHPSSTPPPSSPHLAQTSNRPSFVEDEPLPYIPPSDGHVATDDKSQLEHIRGLASSPPTVVDAAGASTIQSVSAPELHEVEDDLEGLDIDLSEVPVSCHDFGFPPSFPPPPSRADIPLPFGYLDDHPLRYGERDDILVSVPAPGSSGPLPGASPAVLPIDDLGLEPSAPPLGAEDELFEDWDDASSYIPEVPTSADPACTIESSISSASRTSLPSTRQSTSRDSILPRYHP